MLLQLQEECMESLKVKTEVYVPLPTSSVIITRFGMGMEVLYLARRDPQMSFREVVS